MTNRLLFGHLRTGRILGEIDATSASWAQVLNDAGSIDQVTVTDETLRKLDLRQHVAGPHGFLAVETDDRIQEAGPVWSFTYDWERGLLTLGAAGLWSLFDYRKVIPVLAAGQEVQDVTTAVSGVSLGGTARALVAQAMTHVGGNLPLVYAPGDVTGDHEEEFPGWKLLDLGGQLRELTERGSGAPDIRFLPRRRADDRRFIEWVMQTGSQARPQLSQAGADWVLDTTSRKSAVIGISSDGDATATGSRTWVTGNGSEEDMLIATAYNPTLVDAGGPLLEQEESRSSVEEQDELDGHAQALRDRVARPVEVIKVTVHASAVREVLAGDYARLVVRDHPWLGTVNRRMRVQKKSGDRGARVVLDMFPLEAMF